MPLSVNETTVLLCIQLMVDFDDEIIIKNKSIPIRQIRISKKRPKEKNDRPISKYNKFDFLL